MNQSPCQIKLKLNKTQVKRNEILQLELWWEQPLGITSQMKLELELYGMESGQCKQGYMIKPTRFYEAKHTLKEYFPQKMDDDVIKAPDVPIYYGIYKFPVDCPTPSARLNQGNLKGQIEYRIKIRMYKKNKQNTKWEVFDEGAEQIIEIQEDDKLIGESQQIVKITMEISYSSRYFTAKDVMPLFVQVEVDKNIISEKEQLTINIEVNNRYAKVPITKIKAILYAEIFMKQSKITCLNSSNQIAFPRKALLTQEINGKTIAGGDDPYLSEFFLNMPENLTYNFCSQQIAFRYILAIQITYNSLSEYQFNGSPAIEILIPLKSKPTEFDQIYQENIEIPIMYNEVKFQNQPPEIIKTIENGNQLSDLMKNEETRYFQSYWVNN